MEARSRDERLRAVKGRWYQLRLISAVGLTVITGVLTVALTPGKSIARRSSADCPRPVANFVGRHRVVGISGVNLGSTPRAQGCSLGLIAASHLGFLRVGLSWAQVETRPNYFDFSVYDSLIAQLAQHHLSLLPILGGPPSFRARKPRPGAPFAYYPPRHTYEFAHFARLAVERYGPLGTFWTAHPDLPRVPIRIWQVWNEPSLPVYWGLKPSAAQYTSLLRATSVAIRNVDPHATIMTAGLPYYSYGEFAIRFFRAMYKDGARGLFQALAFHAYAPSAHSAFTRLLSVRHLMDRFGDRKVPIWITEFGWASGGPPGLYRKGIAGQGVEIARFMHYIDRNRRRSHIGGVSYGLWRDAPIPSSSQDDYWGLHDGLLDMNARPKPALRAFVRAAAILNR